MNEKLSICIPAHNEEKFIGQVLDSVLKQKGVVITEILVGINSSTDSTKKIVEEYALIDRRIRIVDSPKGKAYAWNALNEQAANKYRVFQDGDCRLFGDNAYEILLGQLGDNDIVSGAVIRDPRSLGIIMKIVNFPDKYYRAHAHLNGNLYLINYDKVASALKKNTGSVSMPGEVINDDIFLQIMVDKIKIYEKFFAVHLTPVTFSDQITRFHRIKIGNAGLKEKYGQRYEERFEKFTSVSSFYQLWYLFKRSTLRIKLLFPLVIPIRFLLYRYIHHQVRALDKNKARIQWK